jgi:hypothetical protein
MVSEPLDDQERELIAAICSELDGVPYVEKARIIRASLESARRGGARRRGEDMRRVHHPKSADRRLVRIA